MPIIRHDLSLDQKISLIKERDNGINYHIFAEKYKISLGAVVNIIKRRDKYLSDYKRNENKEAKRKMKNNVAQQIDEKMKSDFDDITSGGTRRCSGRFFIGLQKKE
jgi:predicted DNA-binding protein YlxM (UPF0122 family)